MEVLIDNKDLKENYSIDVLDYTGALSFASERENEREWEDKSGVDKNLENIRYEAKEFQLKCVVKADSILAAHTVVNTLVEYMFQKGCFVLSLRDPGTGERECFICERSSNISPNINIREQNSLYHFKIGLKDINPNAIKYKTNISGNSVTITYTKGQRADIYWGDGSRGEVDNSGDYTKDDYVDSSGQVDVIIDVDKDADDVAALQAEFTADETSGVKDFDVQFTDQSTGNVVIWSWNFGDGNTSAEQNPSHTYTEPGTYTVTLQVFNEASGSDVEIKTDYITVRAARGIWNDAGEFGLINSTDYGLIN